MAKRLDTYLVLVKLLFAVVLLSSASGCSFHGSGAKPRAHSSSGSGRKYQVFKNGGELSWPVAYGRLASHFGPRDGSFHDGLDLASDSGLAVRAAHSGKVVYSGNRLSGYGNLVIVKDRNGLLSIYAHNEKNHVTVGDNVRRGQVIASLGATGRASGPHLHFEVRMKDRKGRYVAIDPLPLLSRGGGKPRFRVNESLTPLFASLW